jgi:2'-5' RNA ligase
MGIRSFLAFELPAGIGDIVARVSDQVRHTPLDAKWVKPRNIHLTVVFLGSVEMADMAGIQAAAGTVCSRHGPFVIALEGAGVFPNRRKPRVLWLGLKGDLGGMSRFRDELQTVLRPFGIKQEKRPFRPHLTLGRFRRYGKPSKDLEDILDQHKDLGSPAVPLKTLVLFKSDLKPGGAVYTKLDEWTLGLEIE